MKKFLAIMAFCGASIFFSAYSQYINTSGSNPYITQYVEQQPENWDKPILFVFYSNISCANCPQAMGMIYDIYENNYQNKLSLFEINYMEDNEYSFRLSYDLTQPLSLVVVRVNDGMSRGYYKIDNPQYWVEQPEYFKENIITQIDNFLAM